MHSVRLVLLTLTIVLTAAVDSRWGAASFAGGGVELRLPGHYLVEPATVHIDVTVAPNAENRVLRIEADGENFFRAADVPLEGVKAPKFHTVWFKNLPGGHYTIRACVLSSADKLALAEAELVVMH